MRYFALLIVLAGCGPKPPFTYETKCLTIRSNLELVVDRVPAYADKAEAIYDQKFGRGQFCDTVQNLPVLVLDEGLFECKKVGIGYDGWCLGYTNTSGVTLQRYGYALLHEILHVRDSQRLEPGTVWHERWKEKGYFDMDNEFMLWSTTESNVWLDY